MPERIRLSTRVDTEDMCPGANTINRDGSNRITEVIHVYDSITLTHTFTWDPTEITVLTHARTIVDNA